MIVMGILDRNAAVGAPFQTAHFGPVHTVGLPTTAPDAGSPRGRALACCRIADEVAAFLPFAPSRAVRIEDLGDLRGDTATAMLVRLEELRGYGELRLFLPRDCRRDSTAESAPTMHGRDWLRQRARVLSDDGILKSRLAGHARDVLSSGIVRAVRLMCDRDTYCLSLLVAKPARPTLADAFARSAHREIAPVASTGVSMPGALLSGYWPAFSFADPVRPLSDTLGKAAA